MIQRQTARLSAPTKNPRPRLKVNVSTSHEISARSRTFVFNDFDRERCLKVSVNTSYTISAHSPTFVFDDFDRKILISHSEDPKIAKYGFLQLCVTVDLHAGEVALVLPVGLTLENKAKDNGCAV